MSFRKEIEIGGRKIGPGHPPFIVAEMSGNHGGSLEKAMALAEEAAKAGVHGFKLQTYTADRVTLDLKESQFCVNDPTSPWHSKSLYELYQEAHTPWEWHKPIFERCRDLGMVAFSTPCDAEAVDFLESLDAPCYKIGSFENRALCLVRKVASTGKSVIISTGMATLSELQEIVECVRAEGCQDLVFLKCTSAYPTLPAEVNLMTLPHMRDLFRVVVGLSDHTLGIGVAVASVALGAHVIEKHFTLSRKNGGVDSDFSLEPSEMRQLVIETRRAWESLGGIVYGNTEAEKKSLLFRRSLYVTQNIPAGALLTAENLKAIRPGFGLPPKHYQALLGQRVNRDVKKGTPVSWDLLEPTRAHVA